MTEMFSRAGRTEALRLLILLAACIFIAEAIITFGLAAIFDHPPAIADILDSVFLTLALVPILYFLVFKPLIRRSDALAASEVRTLEAEKARSESQATSERFADVIESTSDWFWEMDADLRFSFVSPRFFEVFPIKPGDFIGKSRPEFAGEKTDDEKWRRHLDDLENHRPFRDFAYTTTQLDGSRRHIVISGKPVFEADGTFKGYRGTGTDRTAEVEASRALEESERQFRNLIEGSIQGVCVLDDWNILFANQAMADIFGYESPDEILALKRIEPLIHPEEFDRQLGYKTARQKGEYAPEVYEARGLKKDGSTIWVEFRVTVVPWQGRTAMQCVVVDITERKRAERALREHNDELTFLVNAARGVLFTCEPEGDFAVTYVSPSVKVVLGYEPADVVNDSSFWPDHIHPDDKRRVVGAVDSLLRHGSHTQEYRIRHADGDYRWVQDQTTLIRDSGGAPIRILGFSFDITERKEAEEALRQQNEQLRERDEQLKNQNDRFNAALENMSQALCMYGPDQRLVVCNRRYALMYDLPPELVQPGVTFSQILEHRIGSGVYAGGDPEAYIKERCAAVLEREPTTKIQELTDGRTVVIAHQPLADGGWLATHEDITNYRRIEDRLAHLAHHDPLTDLPNRVALRDRLEEKLKSVGGCRAFALLYLDLDGFKAINDTLGHSTGDELLKAISQRLNTTIRQTDMLVRLGGDEFAIIQGSAEQPFDAAGLAHRLCEAMTMPVQFGHHEVVVGISIGIAFAPKDGRDPDDLLRNADLALYQAKSHNRGTFCLFEPAMKDRLVNRHQLGLELRKALARDEFELHYQPLVNLETMEVTGFEALLRWHHSERGTVSPADFIPIAEETGLIGEIGARALKQACTEAANWPDHLKVAVNVSPVQFKRGNLLEVVRGALQVSGLAANRLELEITESVLLQDDEATLDMLHKLKELGVRISMDDFGTGYSSLSYLRSFPFDKIKIDASFVQDLSERNKDIGLLHAAVRLAARLGATITTAEGVETQEQLEIVKAEGCTEAQGYLFSPALPADEIPRLLTRYQKKVVSAA